MVEFLWKIFREETELKRQTAHLSFGLLYALFYSFGYIDVWVSGGLLAASILLAVFLKRRRSFVDRIVMLVEREEHFWNLPLRGLIFFLLGTTLTIGFFSFIPALAGILILSITDSIGTLYGKYLGVMKIRWNPNKHMEGPVVGGFLAALMLLSFMPLMPALIASYAGAFIDTLNVKILGIEIDDNLLIPIITAEIVKLLV